MEHADESVDRPRVVVALAGRSEAEEYSCRRDQRVATRHDLFPLSRTQVLQVGPRDGPDEATVVIAVRGEVVVGLRVGETKNLLGVDDATGAVRSAEKGHRGLIIAVP